MKHIVLAAVMYSSLCTFAQPEPKIVGYFDLGWRRVPKERMSFYRTVEPAGDKYLVKDYYKSGHLQMEAICTAYEPKLIWKGDTKLYHENGKISEDGMFENEARIGTHTYWYDDGKKKKEVIHGGKKNQIVQFWSRSGEPLLVNGNGTIRESDDDRASYMDVQDSIMVTAFNVRNGIDTVYTMLPQQPEYAGGINALMSALRDGIQYPKIARRRGTQGRVFVKFIVDKQGLVRNAEVLKGISTECDAESLRVVSTLNHWSPGQWRGKPVAVTFVLPINFALK